LQDLTPPDDPTGYISRVRFWELVIARAGYADRYVRLERYSVRARIVLVLLLIVVFATSCKGLNPQFRADSNPHASILLVPSSTTFEIEKVRYGAVHFTASIKNEGIATINVAHPSICIPADYKPGKLRRFSDSHGKSEILLKITKPDGTNVVLRDGYIYHFDPDNVSILTIPPNGAGTFHVGWFFENARGRWERDDEAAKVFLLKGQYKIRILFRNVLPKAALYDENTKETKFIDAWIGEIESPEITIEVK